MKPKPFNLEEFKKWRAKTNPDMMFSISQIEFIKQQVKSACEFYLRYKDKVILDVACGRHPVLSNIPTHWFCFMKIPEEVENSKYGEWLFKIAFKDVLEVK